MRLNKDHATTPEQEVLLTMVVTEAKVTFFQNLEKLGESELPRQGAMTDCFNGGEGTLIGSAGVSLGVVRYYPFAMNVRKVEEIFRQGGLLSDLSTGTTPDATDSSPIAGIGRALGESITKVDLAVSRRQTSSQINVALQEAKANPPPAVTRSPTAPEGVINASATNGNTDAKGNKYTQLVLGPYFLSSTKTSGNHRTISGYPSFAGTGATFTYWYRAPKYPGPSGTYVLLKKLVASTPGGTGGKYCWYKQRYRKRANETGGATWMMRD